MNCKKCAKNQVVKNGFVRGKQRYRCKECLYNFVEGDERVKQENTVKRALAIILYSMSKGTFNFLGRLFKVSPTTVYKWVRKEAEMLPYPEIKNSIQEIEIDEMWHFVQSKKTSVGYKKRWIVAQGKPLPGLQVVVMLKPSDNCIKS